MLGPYALGLPRALFTLALRMWPSPSRSSLADCSAPKVTLSPKVTLRLARGLTAPHVALPYLMPVPEVTWPLPL